MTVGTLDHFGRHAEIASACPIGTPRCISHVAAVCRSVCGVTLPRKPARLTACLKPVFTDLTGAPRHSTKCDVTMNKNKFPNQS